MKRLLILLPFLVFHLSSEAQDNKELLIINRIDHLDELAREPMLAQHPNGTLFLTGYRNAADEPQLWKSLDSGKHWQSVNVGKYEDGAQGNSDADLYIDNEGNIFLLSMSYTKAPEDRTNLDMSTLIGEQVVVGVSRDIGETWKWSFISKNDYDDRPWIEESSNGDLHIIWNDGKGVHHSKSTDKGETWIKQTDINAKGGSSFFAKGPNGNLALRIAPLSASGYQIDEGVDLIKLSNDNGKTWKDVKFPEELVWSPDMSGLPRWTEPIGFDSEGNLYALWSTGNELKLAITKNEGKSWSKESIFKSEQMMYFPYMEISDDFLMITWLSGNGKSLRHNAGVISLSNQNWNLLTIPPQKLDIRARFANSENGLSTGGEYFPIIKLANGNFGMATTIQNQTSNRLGFSFWELLLSKY